MGKQNCDLKFVLVLLLALMVKCYLNLMAYCVESN